MASTKVSALKKKDDDSQLGVDESGINTQRG